MGQILTRLDSTQLVSGQVDKIIVAFGLTEEWSGMSIVARFCKDLQSEIYDIELSSNYEAEIPHEVMDSAGTFQMSLRGEKDDRVITSNAVSYTVLDTILGVGVSSEPTETIYDKIANSQEINAALNAAIDAKQNAKTSEINAKASENAANSSAQSASDSANAAKNYAAATYASAGNVLTKTVSGQFVHAEDAFEGGQIRGFKIKGQTKQNTTTGKNLLDPECLMDRSGIYYLDYEYNVVVKALDGSAWNSITRTLSLSAGTYTFSVGTNQAIEYIVNGSEDFKEVTSSRVITFDSDVELFIKLLPLSSSYPVTMNCQIEKGSTATDYEPYTGGKPSPSPDYPQKISVIENPKIVIDNVEYSITMPEEHPYLASINGTNNTNNTNNTISDELVIDDSGVGYVIARVFRDYITEVSSYEKPDSYFFVKTNIKPLDSPSDRRWMLIADKMYTSNKMKNYIYRTWNSVIVGNFSGSSMSDAIAIMDSVKPVTIYAVSPEIMYHISIDNMPKQLSSNLLGNCICDDPSISPEIEVTYERDLNAVIAKLESPQE